MKASEMILLGLFALFAGVLLFNCSDMPYSSGHSFGAGFLPINMSVAVIALAGIIAVRAVLNRKKTLVNSRKEATGSHQASRADEKPSYIAPISTIVLLVAATALMGFGSVLAPLAILMLIISLLFLRNTWFHSIRMTIVTLAAIYLIFSVWLGIPIH